jgi:hypothetical protein
VERELGAVEGRKSGVPVSDRRDELHQGDLDLMSGQGGNCGIERRDPPVPLLA